MAKIYHTNGKVTMVEPKNGTDFSLEELQAIVGGYIEILHTNDDNKIIVVNEEGKVNDLEVNRNATVGALAVGAISIYDYIAGDALFCDDNQVR